MSYVFTVMLIIIMRINIIQKMTKMFTIMLIIINAAKKENLIGSDEVMMRN